MSDAFLSPGWEILKNNIELAVHMAVDYSKIITDICKDILKLTDMFPYFIIAAVLITCFIYTIFRWHKKLKFVLWCLFIFYIEALLWITFFSRDRKSVV